MEEKIIAILKETLGEINEKFAEINEKFARIDEKFARIDEKFARIDEKFDEMKQENIKLREELKKEILDYMFLFEENYGRKINIMYEELTAKMQNERSKQEEILALERRVDKNSAFIFSHENRITALERANK